jgi:hypothetical protein
MEQLRHYSSDSAKMPGTKRSAEVIAKTFDFYKSPLIRHVDVLNFRGKDKARSPALTDLEILLERPRIAEVVFTGTKLQGIDENADRDKIGAGPCRINQAGMTGVQSTHCRNKADPLSRMTNERKALSDFIHSPRNGKAHFSDGLCGKRPDRTSSM